MSAINYKQKRIMIGIILLEMMLCVFFEIIILGFLIELYFTSQHAYGIHQSLVEIEDHAQSAIEILTSEIHQSGYVGCANLMKYFSALQGTSNEIISQHARYPNNILLKANDEYNLVISNDVPLKPGESLIISNCFHAEIFIAETVTSVKNIQIIRSNERIKYHYEPFTEVSQLMINRFYLNNHALFMQTIKGNKIKLVEHINNIHFSYLIKYENKLLEVEAQDIHDWHDVRGVFIEIEIESKLFKKKWYAYAKTYR